MIIITYHHANVKDENVSISRHAPHKFYNKAAISKIRINCLSSITY